MSRNLINSDCEIHKKPCQYICSYSKCAKNLICQKCRRQHLSRHPAQFIYELSNLSEIHSFNKIDKLKQTLIKEKLQQQTVIRDIFFHFENLTTPLNNKVRQFAIESRDMIEKELSSYLRANKNIIQETEKKIVKSPTEKIKDNPNKMLEETIDEAEIINKRETRINQNGEGYKWYSDTTKSMCENMVAEIASMISVAIKIIENSLKLQRNKYIADNLTLENPHDTSFYKRYPASTTVSYEKHTLQAQVLKSKNAMNWKQLQVSKANKEIRQKVTKIQELQQKVQGLKQQLIGWQQKAEIQEREKRQTVEQEKKRKEEVLIKNGIIGSNGKSISLERKNITKDDLPLILEIVPNPLCLDLSNNNLQDQDLQIFYRCHSIQILKYNFTRVKPQVLIKLFSAFPHLAQLQLNSAQIDDNIIMQISKFFPTKIKVLYLIDNKITDDGLENMFMNMNHYEIEKSNEEKMHTLDELYISYNKLTQRSVEIIHKYSYQIKKLHIAKNQLKGKGGQSIGKYLKDVEQLFVGATGLTKDSFLAIVRNCLQLKRLSLVANEVSTEIVTQILLGLHELKWLDISYCNMTKSDMEKIDKLKIFNKELEIITTG